MRAENINSVEIKNNKVDEKWYQQFWPWFLIALPGTVVVACFYTLYIALTYPHSMVDDSYYKEGLAINKTLAQDREATALGLRAQVSFFTGENSDQVDVALMGKRNRCWGMAKSKAINVAPWIPNARSSY